RHARPADRGIRRQPAAGARQCSPGVRARAAVRVGPAAVRPVARRPLDPTNGVPVTDNSKKPEAGDNSKTPSGRDDSKSRAIVPPGASGGIARAPALAFAERGAKIALLARGEEGLAGAARDVEARGGTALPIPTATSDPAQVGAG